MKVLGKNASLCDRCHACEEACSGLYFKDIDRQKSSVRITVGEADATQITACSQCGFCADICPVQAITRDVNGVWRINKALCVGCFACVGFCPEAAMFHHDDYLEPFKCVVCGVCIKACPTGALFMVERKEGDLP